MMDLIMWFVANWEALAGVLSALLLLASLVTALTPTPKDDEIVRKITAFFSFLKPRDQAGALKAPMTTPREPLMKPRPTRANLPPR